MFAHVRDVLQWAGLSSAIGTEYSSVLRANLLAAPPYCAATPRDTFQGLSSSHPRPAFTHLTCMHGLCLATYQPVCDHITRRIISDSA